MAWTLRALRMITLATSLAAASVPMGCEGEGGGTSGTSNRADAGTSRGDAGPADLGPGNGARLGPSARPDASLSDP